MPTKPTSDSTSNPQSAKNREAQRAKYKTPEFRDALTDAFHKAKIRALEDQSAKDDEEVEVSATR